MLEVDIGGLKFPVWFGVLFFVWHFFLTVSFFCEAV